jgi:hypothetical protein
MIELPKTLVEPSRPATLPYYAKWLAGEGAGSWFIIEDLSFNCLYRISRFSSNGDIECLGHYKSDYKIDLNSNYTMTYPSHCSIVSIEQENKKNRFKSLPL